MNTLAFLSMFSWSLFAANTEDITLKVDCTGLSGEAGSIVLSVYENDDQFPNEPVMYTSVQVKEGQQSVTVAMAGLEPGTYAATLLHDTDGDERMDTNIIGIPREGFAFSNNAKPSVLGAPSFSACTFMLKDEKTISLEMIYF